jgi:CHASE2 domain-containing sensor protein
LAPQDTRRFEHPLAETRVHDVVILAAASSAGVHAALVPEHLRENAAAGGGFVAASVLLLLLVGAVSYRADSRSLRVATALVFVGLLISYALAVTTGIPWLQPEPERVEGLALATKSIEALGLAGALELIRRHRASRLLFSAQQPEGA